MIGCDTPVQFTNGDDVRRHFTGIRRCGFANCGFLADFYSGPSSVISAWLPISSREYRRTHANPAHVRDFGTGIGLTGDAGLEVVLEAPRYVLDHLLRECNREEIPQMPVMHYADSQQIVDPSELVALAL